MEDGRWKVIEVQIDNLYWYHSLNALRIELNWILNQKYFILPKAGESSSKTNFTLQTECWTLTWNFSKRNMYLISSRYTWMPIKMFFKRFFLCALNWLCNWRTIYLVEKTEPTPTPAIQNPIQNRHIIICFFFEI